MKCPECGQEVTSAQVLVFGALQSRLFTAKPAIVYTVELHPGLASDREESWAVRYQPDLKLYLYHEAVCPRRQVVTVAGAPTCQRCPSSIRWAISPLGKPLPLDAQPVTVYELDDASLVPQMTEHVFEAELYLSHFASCAYAREFSKAARR